MILLVMGAQLAHADPDLSLETDWFAGSYRFAQTAASGATDNGPLYPGRLAFGWPADAAPTHGLLLRGSGSASDRLGFAGELRAESYTESFDTDPGSGFPAPAPDNQDLLHAAATARLQRTFVAGRWTVHPNAGLGLWASDIVLHGSRGAARTPATRAAWAVGPLLAGGADLAWGDRLFGGAEAGLGLIGVGSPALLTTEATLGCRLWEGLYASAGLSWSGRLVTLRVDGDSVGQASDQLGGALLGIGYRL